MRAYGEKEKSFWFMAGPNARRIRAVARMEKRRAKRRARQSAMFDIQLGLLEYDLITVEEEAELELMAYEEREDQRLYDEYLESQKANDSWYDDDWDIELSSPSRIEHDPADPILDRYDIYEDY